MLIKKTIYNYLDSLYPDLYMYKTVFGDVPLINEDTVVISILAIEIGKMFNCDQEFAVDAIYEWLNCRPTKVLTSSQEFEMVIF